MNHNETEQWKLYKQKTVAVLKWTKKFDIPSDVLYIYCWCIDIQKCDFAQIE